MAETKPFTCKISLAHIRKVKDIDELISYQQGGNFKKYAAYLCEKHVILEWSLPAPVDDPQSILEMDVADWKVLREAIAENFQGLIE